jgi:hypothetical protein
VAPNNAIQLTTTNRSSKKVLCRRFTMGRKKRNSSAIASDSISGDVVPSIESKKPKAEEKYLVKKYRPEKHYEAMDAFLKYTKSHRMLDASYVRTFKGTTPEKPFIFSVRVAGTDLAWGRGSTREKAMDCACRGAFALVAAHGYNNFPLDDDCLTQEPQDMLPPPPPPPLPPGFPPGYTLTGLPPHPFGAPPPPLNVLPPPPPPQVIPQPKILSDTIPVASSLGTNISMPSNNAAAAVMTDTKPFAVSLSAPQKKTIKGGLTLVFDSGEDGPNELCMEERRASLDRYQKLLRKALVGA